MKHRTRNPNFSGFNNQSNPFNQPNPDNTATLVQHRLRQARSSGKLNLSTLDLPRVPEAVYTVTEGTQLETDEKWWEVVEITHLNLSNNLLTSLSNELVNFAEHLEVLNLENNQLTQLPTCCFDMPCLKVLNISKNKLHQLPPDVGNLQSLVVLNVSSNQIAELPNTFGQLSMLEVANLSHNRMRRLPSVIGLCKRLKCLQVNENDVCSVGDSVFSDLPVLETLELMKNNLEALPENIHLLCSLSVLDLRYNMLQHGFQLPSNLDQCLLGFNRFSGMGQFKLKNLKKLTVLNMCDCSIGEISPDLLFCTLLKVLDLSNNDINDVPHGVGYLPKLQNIALFGNPLRTMRLSLLDGGCEKLKQYLRTRGPVPSHLTQDADVKFHDEAVMQEEMENHDLACAIREAAVSGALALSGKKDMVELPRQFSAAFTGELASITRLTLSGNKLSAVPAGLDVLGCLEELDLRDNCIQVLPASLAHLNVLVSANFSRNQLTDRGVAMLNVSRAVFPSLRELDLSQNTLTSVPEVVGYCKTLEKLNLSYNRILGDNNVLFGAPQLSSVDLGNNRLDSLPRAILGMKQLEFLNLENNNISQIPPEVGLLPCLKGLMIVGNPQRMVRMNVVQKGSLAIIEYLKSRVDHGGSKAPPVTEAKLAPDASRSEMGHSVAQNFERLSVQPEGKSLDELYLQEGKSDTSGGMRKSNVNYGVEAHSQQTRTAYDDRSQVQSHAQQSPAFDPPAHRYDGVPSSNQLHVQQDYGHHFSYAGCAQESYGHVQQQSYGQQAQPYDQQAYQTQRQPYGQQAYQAQHQSYDQQAYQPQHQPYGQQAYQAQHQSYDQQAYQAQHQSYDQQAYQAQHQSYNQTQQHSQGQQAYTQNNQDSLIQELVNKISQLENDLDSPSMTQAKRSVVKKDLARSRGELNRLRRGTLNTTA